MKELRKLCLDLMKYQSFDSLGVGIMSFVDHSVKSIEITRKNCVEALPRLFFDLASITKSLTNSLAYFDNPKIFTDDMILLLDHRAGLPSGGRLSKDSWREDLLEYKIKESETLYSDYSSLRLMLEVEKASGKKLKDICTPYYDINLKHWKELGLDDECVITGFRRGNLIQGQVHDDNAFQLNEFVSHAGLFATVDGLAKTLFNMDKKLNLLAEMDKQFKSRKGRFLKGFDTVEDPAETLAGQGCSSKTFGHLGFTGTSYWIDLEKKRGVIILTNGTQNFWYARQRLNHLRKEIGSFAWS